MGWKQVGIKKHFTEHAEEDQNIKPKIAGNTRGKLSFII